MGLTRAQLRDEVDKNLGGRGADEDPASTRLNRHLDLSQTRIARGHEWKELFRFDSVAVAVTGTPADDVTYTGMPVTLKEIYGLMRLESGDTQALKLHRMPNRQWEQMVGKSDSLSTGRVTHYMLWHRTGVGLSGTPTIEWYRTPDTAFTLYRRYSIWPAVFPDDDTDSDLINKDDLIIADATHFLFQSLGNRDSAAVWFAIAADLFGKAKEEDMHRPDMAPLPMGLSEDLTRGMGPDYWRDPFARGEP